MCYNNLIQKNKNWQEDWRKHEKTFKKKENVFSILLIVAYVILNSYYIHSFGLTDYRIFIINAIFSLFLIYLMIVLKRVKYYEIKKTENHKKYLYFFPLELIN